MTPVVRKSDHDGSIYLPFFHLVSDAPPEIVRSLYRTQTRDSFEAFVRHAARRYASVSMVQIQDHVRGLSSLPPRAIHLSFDDGFNSMSDVVAPILKRYGMHATFFVCSDFVDNKNLFYRHAASAIEQRKAMWTERGAPVPTGGCPAEGSALAVRYRARHTLVAMGDRVGFDAGAYLAEAKPYLGRGELSKLLADGFSIGAHSGDHPRFSEIVPEEQLRQVTESVAFLERELGVRGPVPFAFPFSDAGVSEAFIHDLHRTGIFPTFGTNTSAAVPCTFHMQRACLDEVDL